MMNRKIKFGIFGHTMLGLGTDAVTYVLAFLTSIVVARPLGPESRGAFALIVMLNQYLVTLFQLGMGSVAEMQLAKKEYSLRAVHSFAIFFSIFAGLCAFFLFLLFREWLFRSFLRDSNPWFCFAAVLIVPLVVYTLLSNKILIGLNEIPMLNFFRLIRSIFNLSGFVILLLVFPLGLTGAMVVWMSETFLFAVLQGLWLLKLSGWKLELSLRIIRESVSFGTKVHFAFLPAAAIMQLDSFVLNYFHGAKSVGLYVIANNAVFRMSLLFNSVLTAAQSSIIGRSRKDSEYLIRMLIRHSVFAASAIAVFFSLTGSYWMLWFYGRAFVPAAVPFAILSFGMIAITVTNFMHVYVIGQLKRPSLSALVNWGSFFLGLVLYFSLVPKFGLLGTAWASVLISIARVLGYLCLLRWTSVASFLELFILRQEDFIFWKQKFRSLCAQWIARRSLVGVEK